MVFQTQHCDVATLGRDKRGFPKTTLRRCDVATGQTWFSKHNTATLRRCDVPNVVFQKQRCNVATLRRGFPKTALRRCDVATGFAKKQHCNVATLRRAERCFTLPNVATCETLRRGKPKNSAATLKRCDVVPLYKYIYIYILKLFLNSTPYKFFLL